jgi:hypothetical protein
MVWVTFASKVPVFEDLGFQAQKLFALKKMLICQIDRVRREIYKKTTFKCFMRDSEGVFYVKNFKKERKTGFFTQYGTKIALFLPCFSTYGRALINIAAYTC